MHKLSLETTISLNLLSTVVLVAIVALGKDLAPTTGENLDNQSIKGAVVANNLHEAIVEVANEEAKSMDDGKIQSGVYQSLGSGHTVIEDRFNVEYDSWGNQYFAVYDGHSNAIVASMLKEKAIKYYILPVISASNDQLNASDDYRLELNYQELKQKLKEAVLSLDQDILNHLFGYRGGATLNIIINTKQYLIAINVGDSRSVMLDAYWNTWPLTEDHKPMSPSERERILMMGSHVRYVRSEAPSIAANPRLISRTSTGLAMSRSMGDIKHKQLEGTVISEPDVYIYKKSLFNNGPNHVSMILLASDGIWDVVTDKQATKLIIQSACKNNILPVNKGKSIDLAKAITNLGQEARKRGTLDDITIVAAILDPGICKMEELIENRLG